jgi:thiol:disulfide interchange protein DsbD
MQKFRYILVTFFTFVSLLILPINVNYASLAEDLNEQQAFILSTNIKNDQLTLDWLIDTNSYLYQDKLEVIEKNSGQNLLKTRNLPPAIKKHDSILGDFYVYQDNLNIKLDLNPDNAENIQSLLIKYQGCSKSSFCYPPVTKQINYTSNKILSITDPEVIINNNQQLSSITLFNLISF